ncbi:hypothetical protein LAZ67_9000495 [Cordylochernes scorpioides]|uniref:Transposase n=1 Tax=Cordylochernes scorpioides TaxID=51811 RepID=A0ABY6KT05_9ARAC|nr:hypothetical protein LAZ67_9000495 [Cordylochernes scorpioides]
MHQRDGDQLFSRIVTGDESWVHHSTPETKRQSMVWKKPEESAPKKAKVTISAGKVMAMENFKWEIFTHPPYSPELAPSDFHLYSALKWHLGGKHFANDDEVQAEANHWLRRQDTAWMVETRSGKMQDPAQERIKAEESAKPQPGATIGRDASSDPVVLNPNIDIPKYDGTEDPRPWIESLEEIGFLYHWADYIISRYAAMNMIGSAKTWLNLHKVSFTSWENFKSRLIEDFASDANKEEMRMRLNRIQQWNEPAIRFAEDILVLCNKVDPQMEEETKINWVIGGLKKEYSFALHLNPPKNTNELLEICKKLDLFEKNYQERAEKSKALYNGPRSPRPHHQEQWKNATSFRRPYQNTSKPQAPAPRYYQNTSKPQAPTPRYYQNKPLPQPYENNFVKIRYFIQKKTLCISLEYISQNKVIFRLSDRVLDRLRFLPIKKIDQRTCIKFCVKNEIKCADAFRMLTVAYGEATLDRSNVYRWYKMFSEGREDVNDEERAGHPSTSTTDEKINEVEKMILANRRITVREVAEDLNISIGSCHSIFINDLGMRRVAAKFVPKLLNCDQKQHRMNIANEMLDSVRDDPNFLQRVITGDEAWVYGYDVETKAQSYQWKLPHEPRPKKARQVRSNVKVLLTVFFDCRGVVHHEFLPQGRTVNKEYYLQVMRNLREAIRQKRSDLWKNKNWLLHHDNAPAHTSLLVRDLLAKNNTLMMPQPPYSPELAPCDFLLFRKLKRPMKGRRYATLDEIKTASKEEVKKILKNDFLKCFEDWKNRWHKCIISHGDYLEGAKIGIHE